MSSKSPDRWQACCIHRSARAKWMERKKDKASPVTSFSKEDGKILSHPLAV